MVEPASTRPTDWPVPWELVAGDQKGVLSHVSYGAVRVLVGGLAALPGPVVNGMIGALAWLGMRLDAKRTLAAPPGR